MIKIWLSSIFTFFYASLKKIFSKSKSFLVNSALQDFSRWFLWTPVGLSMGILIYFQLNFEPSLSCTLLTSIAGLGLLGGLWPRLKNHKIFTEKLGIFWYGAIISLIIGFNAAKIRTELLGTVFLKEKISKISFMGTLLEVEHPVVKNSSKRRIIVSNLVFKASPIRPLPSKIRLNIAAKKLNAEPGDQIQCQADLLPISFPVSLTGFDFQRHSYFQGVGAVGRVTLNCQLVKKAQKTQFYQWRYQLTQVLRHHLSGQAGEIAGALITGDRSGISKDVRQNFANAGIAHILAISGLHISLVASVIFLLVRRGLTFLIFFNEKFHTKKWAAIIAIFAIGGYLAISGYGFPAIRSFIMTSLVMVAILVNRQPLSMRFLSLAATFILLLYPESILSISFQLSFAAVLALIAFYEGGYRVLKDWSQKTERFVWLKHVIVYVVGIILSTVIATLATTPFIIYTFNNYTLQAVLGNLIGIPLVSLWIMPLAVLSLLSLVLGGIPFIFKIWGLGINILTKSAEYISHLPGAAIFIATPPSTFLALISFGGIWVCLWKLPWRWLGLIPIIGSIGLMFCDHHTHLYIAGDGSVIAYRQGKVLNVSSLGKGKFYYDQWSKELGGIEIKKWQSENIILPSSLTLISDPYYQYSKEIQTLCAYSKDWIISNGYIWRICGNLVPKEKIIDRYHLKKNGTYLIYLREKRDPRIVVLKEALEKRPWHLK